MNGASIIIAALALAIAAYVWWDGSKKRADLEKKISALQDLLKGFDPKKITEKADKVDSLETRLTAKIGTTVESKLAESLGMNSGSSLLSSAPNQKEAVDKIVQSTIDLIEKGTGEFAQSFILQLAKQTHIGLDELPEATKDRLYEPVFTKMIELAADDDFELSDSEIRAFDDEAGAHFPDWLKAALNDPESEQGNRIKTAYLEQLALDSESDSNTFVSDNWDEILPVILEIFKTIIQEELNKTDGESRKKLVDAAVNNVVSTLEDN